MKELFAKYKVEFKNNIKQLKNKETRIKQIPNLLTFSRFVAPIIIIPLIILKYYNIAMIITILFALTDLIDGYIARKYNVVSEFGRELDPICDKFFIGGIIIALTFKNKWLILPLLLELIVSIITIYKKSKKGKPKTNLLGKIKTTFLYILIAYTYLTMFKKMNIIVFTNIYVITLITQVISLLVYIYEFFKGNEL